MSSTTNDGSGQQVAPRLHSTVPGVLIVDAVTGEGLGMDEGMRAGPQQNRVHVEDNGDGTFSVIYEGGNGVSYYPPSQSLGQRIREYLRMGINGRYTEELPVPPRARKIG
jgi:hypothetical protein